MWLSGYGGRAFHSMLWPLLGFCLLPFTTCFYAMTKNEHGDISGWSLALAILGVFLDIGNNGGGEHTYRRRVVMVRRD